MQADLSMTDVFGATVGSLKCSHIGSSAHSFFVRVDGRGSSRRVPSSGQLHERWWLQGCTANRTLQLWCPTGRCTRLACSVSGRLDACTISLSPATGTPPTRIKLSCQGRPTIMGAVARESRLTRLGCSSSMDTSTSRGCCRLRPDLPDRCSRRWRSAQVTGNAQQKARCASK
jgi:hypothetical protein